MEHPEVLFPRIALFDQNGLIHPLTEIFQTCGHEFRLSFCCRRGIFEALPI